MFNQGYAEAATEVLDILDHMGMEDFIKVPTSFIKVLEDNASKDYTPELDYSKPLNEMNIKDETKGILGVLYREFWCPKDKISEYNKKIAEDEQRFRNEIREKYNPDEIFKKPEVNEISQDSSELVVVQESFFRKIINKLKSFFIK